MSRRLSNVDWPPMWPETARAENAYRELVSRVSRERQYPFGGDPWDVAQALLTERVVDAVGDFPTEDQVVAIATTLTGKERLRYDG